MKLLVFVETIISITVTSIFRGFAFQKFWTWFIIPLFHIPEIGIAQSLGLMLVVGMLTDNQPSKEENKSSFVNILVMGTIKSLVVTTFYLVIGFVVKSFV